MIPSLKVRDLEAEALSRKRIPEEELERLDEEIEELLFKNCPQEQKESIKKEISEKLFLNQEEIFSVYKTRMVKFLRERHKIPYVSLFYY